MQQKASPIAHPGLLARVLDWFRVHRVASDELGKLSQDELWGLSNDLALNEGDLRFLSASLADNTALMERMIRARGFDPEHLRQCFATLMRDVERVCSACHSAGRCRRELDAGTATAHAHEFCPNAGTFDDLLDYTTSL